jgi:hypothetical protein
VIPRRARETSTNAQITQILADVKSVGSGHNFGSFAPFRIFMKSINTLIKDVNDVLSRNDKLLADNLSEGVVGEVRPRIHAAFTERPTGATLRLSQMGARCPRSLWASIHSPSIQEPLPTHARLKYTYGHLIEALLVAMAKAAGHEVTGEGDELFVDGIRGHRDCVIDGCIVDVKSASSMGFQKFKDKSIASNDAFGYLDQLDGYLVGSLDDPLVRVKDRAYLWACDKTLGHMCLYEHRIREDHIRNRIRTFKEIVARDEPPACTCGTVADGKSGNIKLDTRASYNSYKHFCFPNLRTFLYASGPVYLTKVVRLPDVPEVSKTGVVI